MIHWYVIGTWCLTIIFGIGIGMWLGGSLPQRHVSYVPEVDETSTEDWHLHGLEWCKTDHSDDEAVGI
jgi:hypothetical protein